MTGDVEEAILEMYLSGISVRKMAGVTAALSRVRIGKDAVSRIARWLQEEQKEWRRRSLGEKSYPYLYLDATYLKVRWGASFINLALLACVQQVALLLTHAHLCSMSLAEKSCVSIDEPVMRMIQLHCNPL